MKAFDADPGRHWTFLFAHPDDELAIAAWMRFLCGQGNCVSAIWLHSNSVREAESRTALAALPNLEMTFLTAPDGEVLGHLDQLESELGGLKTDRLAVCAFEQGHLDHDAAHLLAHRVFSGEIVEFPLYHPYTTRFPRLGGFAKGEGEARTLNDEEKRFKRAMLRAYPSQSIRRNLVGGELRARLRGRSLLACEHLRPAHHRDFLTPNLPEPLLARVLKSEAWRKWCEGASRWLD